MRKPAGERQGSSYRDGSTVMQSHVTTEHEMIMECDQENVNVLLVIEMGGVGLCDVAG